MKKEALYSSLVLVFISSLLKAQLGPETYPMDEPKWSHQYRYLDNKAYFFIDTSFNSLHWYHQFNTAGRDLFGYSRLGNMGGALNSQRAEQARDIWYYFQQGAYASYFRNASDIPFYYTRSPLTEANYWSGYERGQDFNFYHTQNINKRWNFSASFNRLNALGDYTRSRNQSFTFLVNTHYQSRDESYELFTYFIGEKLQIQENGGIANPLEFEENSQFAQPRTLLDVRLPNDERIMRNQQWFLRHELDLAKLFAARQEEDTAGAGKNIPSIGLGHEILYLAQSNTYLGSGSTDFYDQYYFQQGSYRDSLAYRSWQNTFYLQAKIGQKSGLDLKAGLRQLVTTYAGDAFNFAGQNWGLTGRLKGNLSDRLEVDARADYILTGPLNQSLKLDADGELRILKKLSVHGGYHFSLRPPDFYAQWMRSNNHIWSNDFNKEGEVQLFAGIRWLEGNLLTLRNRTFTSKVYYDAEASPAQAGEVVNLIEGELQQNFTIWNFLHQDNRAVVQQSSNQEVMPLPNWVLRHSLYFEFNLFDRVLNCLAGAEVNYFSRYDSPSYDPALGVFYNAAERSIGDYPLVDLFAQFELEKARIFVKYEHANMGVLPYEYYAAPRHPFPDRSLRFGITWRFFN